MGADGMSETIMPVQQQQNNMLQMLTLLLIGIVGVISVVALVLGAVSLSLKTTNNITVGGNAAGTPNTDRLSGTDDKIWTFAIGHDGTNLEYIEDTSGTLRGFHVDIVNAICELANKNCRLIWDVYSNCWNSQAGERARGGTGIMASWYDGCTGWFNTYTRALTVDFTAAFRKPLKGVFFVKNGNPDGFDWKNISSNQKIGFWDGAANDEHCLARMGSLITGVPLQPSQIVHYISLEAALMGINNGEISAVFANTNQYGGGELDSVSDELLCSKDGGCMMMRKDTPLAGWWNDAFSSLKQSNQYADICRRVDSDHGQQPGAGGQVICVD